MASRARKLAVCLSIATLVLALPVAVAMASGGGGGGNSGGGSSGGAGNGSSGSGGSSGGGAGNSGGGANTGAASEDNGLENGNKILTIPNDDVANAEFLDAQKAIAGRQFYVAVSDLQQVLQRQPNNPDVLNLMGFSNRKLGKRSEALSFYEQALALQPMHIGANEYLGELYLELKLPDKAKERLAVLHEACGDCMEYAELKDKIDKYQMALN